MMKKRSECLGVIIIYMVFLVLMIGVLFCKKNFHIDELLSYGLANDAWGMSIDVKDTVKYEPSEEPFMKYLAINDGERFNYRLVWANQTYDVHPPLYYVALHTICSLFPGEFSIWFAGIINIVFGIFTLIALRKLADELFEDAFVKNLMSVLFVLSAEVLTMVSFLRMYIMAMFLVTLITWFFVKIVRTDWKIRDYIILYTISVASALTHYYCVVYLVLICAVYGIWLLKEKCWLKIAKFCITMLGAAGTAILIFPAMIEHVFSGYRGTQSIKNFANTSLEDYWDRLQGFYAFLNTQLFGGMLSVVLVFLLIVGILRLCDKKCFENGETIVCKYRQVNIKWILMLVPIGFYFLIVAKMAVYIDERYISPIFPIAVLLFVGILFGILKKYFGNIVRKFYLGVISAAIIVNGWHAVEWKYLYVDSQNLTEETKNYADVDCVVLYGMVNQALMSYLEIANYKSVTFLDAELYQDIEDIEISRNDKLMVILMNKKEDMISEILEICPYLDKYEKIGEFGYGHTYYLYSANN